MAIFWHIMSSCFQTADWRRAVSVGQCQGQAERESACARHPLAFPHRAFLAGSGRTQPLRLTPKLFPTTGLQQNAFPHSTPPTLLPWTRSASPWRGSVAVDDQPEPLPGNAPTCLPPQTSRLCVRRSWGERRGMCGDCCRLSVLLWRVEPMRSRRDSDTWIQELQNSTQKKRLSVSRVEKGNKMLNLSQLKEISLNSARLPPTFPRSGLRQKKCSNLTQDQTLFKDFTRRRQRRIQTARYCVQVLEQSEFSFASLTFYAHQ